MPSSLPTIRTAEPTPSPTDAVPTAIPTAAPTPTPTVALATQISVTQVLILSTPMNYFETLVNTAILSRREITRTKRFLLFSF
jgi:hypothetical protein